MHPSPRHVASLRSSSTIRLFFVGVDDAVELGEPFGDIFIEQQHKRKEGLDSRPDATYAAFTSFPLTVWPAGAEEAPGSGSWTASFTFSVR